METHETGSWRSEVSIETKASPQTIWRLFSDVPGWKTWNAGIESISIHGPFAVGTEFVMQPPGQGAFTSRLVDVRENELFVDATVFGDLAIVVAHRIDPLGPTGARITYAIEASGPGCSEVGPAVSSDFPDVLKALVQLAERETA